MIKNTETFEDSYELIVDYHYELKDTDNHHDGVYDTVLNSVEIMVGKKGVDILPLLDDKQIQAIIYKLTYE